MWSGGTRNWVREACEVCSAVAQRDLVLVFCDERCEPRGGLTVGWEVAGNYGALTLGHAEWVGLMSEGAGLSSGRGVGAVIILRGRGPFAWRVLRNLLLYSWWRHFGPFTSWCVHSSCCRHR